MRKTHVRFCERADAGLITWRHPTRSSPVDRRLAAVRNLCGREDGSASPERSLRALSNARGLRKPQEACLKHRRRGMAGGSRRAEASRESMQAVPPNRPVRRASADSGCPVAVMDNRPPRVVSRLRMASTPTLRVGAPWSKGIFLWLRE